MRRAGILLHPTSLPGDGPCGALGADTRQFLDWLVAAGCSLWQVLPLHPPGRHLSPYDSPSSAALDTRLIDLDDLVADGVLSRSEVGRRPRSGDEINPEDIAGWHRPHVERAADALVRSDPTAVSAFEADHPWVRDWARFTALTSAHGVDGWWALPPAYRNRHAAALSAADRAHAAAIQREIAAQLLVHRQWSRVRDAAAERGIRIIGDVPIFVARDGVDTWVHRSLFRLQPDGRPDPTTGAPPDSFSEHGQAWNNPHYDWEVHVQTGFAWWVQRFKAAMARFDCTRVDHFRGWAAAWAIPAAAGQDARQGTWEPAPGAALLDALRAEIPGLRAIAEDLGHITPDVVALRENIGWPGMKVLQFAFDGTPGNPYLPPYTDPNCVVYTGTHDNDTTIGWYETSHKAVREQVSRQAGSVHPCADPAGALLRLAWASAADWAIAPMQDVLRLGTFARMNAPGREIGNWRWRARALPATAAAELAALADETDRLPADAAHDEGL